MEMQLKRQILQSHPGYQALSSNFIEVLKLFSLLITVINMFQVSDGLQTFSLR